MQVNDIIDEMVFEVENNNSKFNSLLEIKYNKSPQSGEKNSGGNSIISGGILPVMPSNQNSRSKFSSWNNLNTELDETEQNKSPSKENSLKTKDQNQNLKSDINLNDPSDFMDEVDELLLEQELLSPTAASQTMKSISNRNKQISNKNKENKQIKSELVAIDKFSNKKLLNGEKDLGDLGLGDLSLSQDDRHNLKKKLGNSINQKNGTKQQASGQRKAAIDSIEQIDDFIMQDISDDLNQLLENYDVDVLIGLQKENQELNQQNVQSKIIKNDQEEWNGTAQSKNSKQNASKNNKQQPNQKSMNSKFNSVPSNGINNSKPPIIQKTNKNPQNNFEDFNEIESLVEEELSRNANNSNQIDNKSEDEFSLEESFSQLQVSQQKPQNNVQQQNQLRSKPVVFSQAKGNNNLKNKGNAANRVGSVGSTPKNQSFQQTNDKIKAQNQSKSINEKNGVIINPQNRSSSSRGSIGSNQGIGGINQNAINILNQVKSKGIASSQFPFPSTNGPQRISTVDANQNQQQNNSSMASSQNNDGQDSLNSSTGSQGGTDSSQMYKDLFSVIKTKPKGIAGIRDVQITAQEGVISDDDTPNNPLTQSQLDSQAFPKLVSTNKANELQILAQINNQDNTQTNNEVERLLNKNRSKKDLKNKFKSSSALFNQGKPENEQKDNDKYDSSPEQESNFDAEKSISEIIKRHIQNEEALSIRKLSAKNGSYPIPDNLAQINGPSKLGLEGLKKYVQNQQNKEKIELDTDVELKQIDEKEIDEIIKQYQIQDQQQQNEEKQKNLQEDQEINQMLAQQDELQKQKKQKKNIKIVQNKIKKKKQNKKDDSKPEDNKDDDNSDDEEDDLDDDEENEIEDETEKLGTKQKKTTGSATEEYPDGYEYLDDSLNLNVKSPKQTLIEHMRLLADIFNSSLDEASEYYDQIFDERAQFMLDFENILKIMTFDETVEYVLPCMQIYSSEQDYLKLKLFQNLEKLFKKLFKAEVFVPKSEIIDIITINIFPLASRMLMLSEEAVQIEGVEALLNLSKQYIPKEQAQNLVMKVVQVIMDRISSISEHQETEEVKEKAKIAVLIIVQKFSEADVFVREQCQYFLQNHFEEIQNGMLFKIKKFLLPALISISKHLDYEIFLAKVYNQTFKQFNQDEIWGVRKVCIENISNLVKYLRYDDVSRINECIDFFKRCLNDSNRWVKNQALINFGPFVHQIFLKIDMIPSSDKNREASIAVIQEKIEQICNIYYDLKLIFTGKDANELENSLMEKLDDYSFMQNKTDDIDKIKYYWAYNMPCALLVNGRSRYWFQSLKNIYEILYKDILINLRTSISASFKEIIEILEINKMEKVDERQFFVTVLNHFLKDSDDISSKVLPTICSLVSKFPDDEKTQLLDNLIRKKIESIKQMKNGRDNLIKMLEQLFQMFQPTQLMEANFHEYLFDIIKNERAINYKLRAAVVLGSKIIAPLIKGKKYRSQLTTFTDELRQSKNFRYRQIYIQIALSTYQSDTEIFKKHFAKNIAQDMENDKCKCVQIALAKLCNYVNEGYSKSLDKVRQKLISDNDQTIIQYMPLCGETAKSSEQQRRYLAIGYGDNKVEGKADENEKQMTEQEWLEKEHKEIEEIEKTVTIRFANYSTLMRAQTLTQGLSAQLAMFLSTMGVNNMGAPGTNSIAATSLLQKVAAKDSTIKNQILSADQEENKRLIDKGGYSRKLADSDTSEKQKEAKLRSLSPLGLLTAQELDKPINLQNSEEEENKIELQQNTQKQEDNNQIDNKKQQNATKNLEKQQSGKEIKKESKK